jgi:YVTN family beta-propeller protein
VVLTPNGTRTYVANFAEDSVSSYSSSSPLTVTTTSLPPGSNPVFLATTDNSNIFVLNSTSNTVSVIGTATNVVTNTVPVGLNPIAAVETPDIIPPIGSSKKVYVGNQGDGTVTVIDAATKTAIGTVATGTSPIWLLARNDSARVYVLNSGAGTMSIIDTASDTVVGSVPVGTGANYMIYDPKQNRVYVTNPAANTVSAIDVSVDATAPLYTMSVAPGPVSIAILPDSSRLYVASDSCSTGDLSTCSATGGTATSQVIVLNAVDGSFRSAIPLAVVATDQVNPTGCDGTRFRVSAAAGGDSTRVYVANCDGGFTDIIDTSDDSLLQGGQFQVTDTDPMTCEFVTAAAPLPGPFSSFNPTVNACEITDNQSFFFLVPPRQNPHFILASP